MDNSSTMISQSIVDKVDMSQFYGAEKGAVGFDCVLEFQENQVFSKMLTFKRNENEVEVTMLCEQSSIKYFINSSLCTWFNMFILADGNEIFQLTDIDNHKVNVDIKYIQDLNCQVKITIRR